MDPLSHYFPEVCNCSDGFVLYTLLTSRRTSLGDGLPIPVIPESKSLERRQELHSLLPASLSYQYKVHRIQTDAVNTIGQYIELDKSDIDSTLHSWTQNFDDRIQEVDVEIVDDIGQCDNHRGVLLEG